MSEARASKATVSEERASKARLSVARAGEVRVSKAWARASKVRVIVRTSDGRAIKVRASRARGASEAR